MFKTISNGQSIHQYIPPHLKRMFYNNPAAVHASQNGIDPYGFSTDGLVLYAPLWAMKDSAFKSVDVCRHACSVVGALWRPNGRLLDGNDYIESTTPALNFTTGNFSGWAWVYPTTITGDSRMLLCRGSANTDGWYFNINTNGALFINTNQAANRASYSANGAAVINKWQLLGFTRIGTACAVWIDAVDATATAQAITNPATCARTLKVGVYDDKVTNPFIGVMGEFGVTSGALSEGEWMQLYQKTKWRYQS